jgi:hypothetical protein
MLLSGKGENELALRRSSERLVNIVHDDVVAPVRNQVSGPARFSARRNPNRLAVGISDS